jgi:hypothetical protein
MCKKNYSIAKYTGFKNVRDIRNVPMIYNLCCKMPFFILNYCDRTRKTPGRGRVHSVQVRKINVNWRNNASSYVPSPLHFFGFIRALNGGAVVMWGFVRLEGHIVVQGRIVQGTHRSRDVCSQKNRTGNCTYGDASSWHQNMHVRDERDCQNLKKSSSQVVKVMNTSTVYVNLKSENSQDYAQKPQQNCTFLNSASVVVACIL